MPERAKLIMEAALELADEGGFEAVRLRDVAQKAGVALGTLYARFKSKEDILVAVLEQEALKLEDVLGHLDWESDDPEGRLYLYFGVATRAMFSRPNFGRAVLRAVSAGNAETAGKIARYQQRLNDLIIRAARGDDDDRTIPEERENEIAFLLQQIWFAALVGWMSGIRAEDEVMSQMKEAIDVVMAGVRAQKG